MPFPGDKTFPETSVFPTDTPSEDYSLLARAIFETVQAAVPDHVVTLNGKPDAPDSLDAYAVVWAGRSRGGPDSYNGRPSSGEMRWQVSSVGVDADTVEWLAGRIFDYLTTNRITGVPGWRFQKARHEYGQLPYVDETIICAPNVGKADTYTAAITRTS